MAHDVTSSGSSRAGWAAPAPARVARIRDRLREVYGVPRMAPHGRPLDELVLTVLSQSTNDRNRDVAFLRLRERFAKGGAGDAQGSVRKGDVRDVRGGSVREVRRGGVRDVRWGGVRDVRRGGARNGADRRPSSIDYAAILRAPVAEVEEAIRPGGISKVKSARIQAILAAIVASARDGRGGRGSLSLEWMRTAPVPESRDYLCALPGVGRKTAACVLLFSYGLRDVPVDTHVSRVGTRLRLLRPGAGFEELHDGMLALTPPGQELELHVNLLRHGRRTCFARKPACEACALARMCPSRGTV